MDADDLTITLLDAYPVSPGHTLVITRRHVADFFETTPDERTALVDATCRARDRLIVERRPDGFNIGVNIGTVAGQTVSHVHMHLIPRYRDDREDPRGGVRAVIPHRAAYP